MRALFAVALLVALAGSAEAQPAPRPARAETPSQAVGTVIARRGDITLTEAGLRDLIERETPEAREPLLRDAAALTQFVRARMLRLTLLEEARSTRFDQRPEVAQRAEQARLEAITDAFVESLGRLDAGFPSEAEVRAVYDANQARFLVPRQYRLSQIFLALPAAAPRPQEEAALARLREWRAAATAPRNRLEFAELARRHSEDRATAARGGQLDWTREDRLIEPVRDAVAGLAEGAISDPVRSPEGLHLIRLDATRPAGPAPLEEVRGQIVAALRQGRSGELARAAVNELLRRQPIQIDEIQLGRLASPR